jgi:hypothetical protein
LREGFGDSGFFDITLGLFGSGKQIEILGKLKQTIFSKPVISLNIPISSKHLARLLAEA